MISRKVLQVVSRQLSTTTRRMADEVHPGYAKLRERQALFQKPNNLPVHLKGGGMDNLLYRTTMGLCILALFCNATVYYSLIFPKK